jgi:hypothetical protein
MRLRDRIAKEGITERRRERFSEAGLEEGYSVAERRSIPRA